MSDTQQKKPVWWAKPPYYKPPELHPEEIDCGVPYGMRPTAEKMMQVNTAETLGWPNGFLDGASGEGALTPSELVDSFITYAEGLTEYSWSQFTAKGFNPALRGAYHASLVISTLKVINAATLDNTLTGSVYSIWIANLKAAGKL